MRRVKKGLCWFCALKLFFLSRVAWGNVKVPGDRLLWIDLVLTELPVVML